MERDHPGFVGDVGHSHPDRGFEMLKNFKEAVRMKDEIVLMNCSIDITRSQMEVLAGRIPRTCSNMPGDRYR